MNASHLPLADENGSQASTRIKDRRFSWSGQCSNTHWRSGSGAAVAGALRTLALFQPAGNVIRAVVPGC